MPEKTFFCLLNKVFSLMRKNRLREDIDDTLFEKLLSLIKENINECFIENLIKNTQILLLCEKSLSCLFSQSKELSSPIIVFSVRLLGMIYEKPNIFIAQKCSSLTSLLSDVLHSNICFSPSVQDAILASLLSIGSHPEGALWLLDQNLVKFVFESFSSTSYYVQKTASNFLPCAFKLWTSSEFLEKLPLSQQNIIHNSVEKTVSHLISNFNPQRDYQNKNYNNCCILTLKQIFQIKNEKMCNISVPLQKVMEYFKNLNVNDKINQDVIDLLLLTLHSDQSNLIIMKDILNALIDNQLFSSAFHLASSFLSDSEAFKPMSCKELAFLLMPLCILSEANLKNLKDDIFGLVPSTIVSSIVEEMEIKSKSVSLISSSLRALCTLTQFMNEESTSVLLSSLKFAFPSFPEEKQLLSFSCLENRMICLSLLELFTSFLHDHSYVKLDDYCRQIIFHYLLQFLQKPSTDCNVISEALNLIKSVVILNAKHKFAIDCEAADELIKLLCRKLLDNKEPIVDSSLHLANEIINGEGHDFWKQFILKDSVHLIIWDIAMQSFPEGFIKASAIKVITETCLNSYFLEDIKSHKTICEMDIMKILISYFQDPDFFVQREAVLCACKWLKSKEHILPASCIDDLFSVLSSAVKSLDLDLKLISLDQWKLCVETVSFFPALSQINLRNCLTFYCSSGFSGSLMHAVDDSDQAVKYKSATILFDLKEKLTQWGLSRESLSFDEFKIDENTHPSDIEPPIEIATVTNEERDKGIDSVMNISTAQQLLNICRVSDCFEHFSYTHGNLPSVDKNSLSCSVECFWTYLWSTNLNILLCTSEHPATISSDYALSLLEDIIAAEITDSVPNINEIPDCY